MLCTIMITWSAYDVQEIHPDWTLEQCSTAFKHIEKDFEALYIPDGWELLTALLKAYASSKHREEAKS